MKIKYEKNLDAKELRQIIFYDLEALKDTFITSNEKDFNYHFELLKGNLKDLFKDYIIK